MLAATLAVALIGVAVSARGQAPPLTPLPQVNKSQYPPATPKSIDPLEPCAYHPALEFDKTLSINARGTAGKTEIE